MNWFFSLLLGLTFVQARNVQRDDHVYGAWSRVVIQLPENISPLIPTINSENIFDLPSEIGSDDGHIQAKLNGQPIGIFTYQSRERKIHVLLPPNFQRNRVRTPHIVTIAYTGDDGTIKTVGVQIYCTAFGTAPAWAYLDSSQQPVIVVHQGSGVFIPVVNQPIAFAPGQLLHFFCYGVLMTSPSRQPIEIVFRSPTRELILHAHASMQAIQGTCYLTVVSVPEMTGMGECEIYIQTPDGISPMGKMNFQ